MYGLRNYTYACDTCGEKYHVMKSRASDFKRNIYTMYLMVPSDNGPVVTSAGAVSKQGTKWIAYRRGTEVGKYRTLCNALWALKRDRVATPYGPWVFYSPVDQVAMHDALVTLGDGTDR